MLQSRARPHAHAGMAATSSRRVNLGLDTSPAAVAARTHMRYNSTYPAAIEEGPENARIPDIAFRDWLRLTAAGEGYSGAAIGKAGRLESKPGAGDAVQGGYVWHGTK